MQPHFTLLILVIAKKAIHSSSATLFQSTIANSSLPPAETEKPAHSLLACSWICSALAAPDCTRFFYSGGTCHVYSRNTSVEVAPAAGAGVTTYVLPPRCPTGWFTSLDLISCYRIVLSRLSRPQAQSNCRALAPAADLAIIRSADENARLAAILLQQSANTWERIWIKLNDLQQEGHFVWHEGFTPAFTAWPAGEPDNYREADCTMLTSGEPRNLQWSDINCATTLTSICELF